MNKTLRIFWDTTSNPDNPGWVAKDLATGLTWQLAADIPHDEDALDLADKAVMDAPIDCEDHDVCVVR